MIYFVQSPAGGPIKIGKTIRLSVRLAELQTEHGKLTILAVLEGSYAKENELHRRFAALRERGEWFSPDADLLEFIRHHGRPWDGTDEVPLEKPGYPIFARIPAELGELLDSFLKAQPYRVTLVSFLETALKEFLQKEGFWPPKKKGGGE